jgi:hypothetical protein
VIHESPNSFVDPRSKHNARIMPSHSQIGGGLPIRFATPKLRWMRHALKPPLMRAKSHSMCGGARHYLYSTFSVASESTPTVLGIDRQAWETERADRLLAHTMRCIKCGVLGCYAEWKIDYSPSMHLLESA